VEEQPFRAVKRNVLNTGFSLGGATQFVLVMLIYFIQGNTISAVSEKRSTGWGFFHLGAGVTAFVALIATSGTLPKWAVILLGLLTAVLFSAGVNQFGWARKAPYKIGRPIRAIFVHGLIWIGTIVAAYAVWPVQNFDKAIISWGPHGPGVVRPGNPPIVIGSAESELIVDGSLLTDYMETHKLMAVCFHHIGTGDVADIEGLSKSGLYDIREGRIQIIVPWNAKFIKEVSEHWIQTGYDLLLVPNGIQPKQFETLHQATALGIRRIKRVSGPP
jgi:hypothetical protein